MGYILQNGQLIPVMIPASVAATASPAPQPHPSLAPAAEAFDPFGTGFVVKQVRAFPPSVASKMFSIRCDTFCSVKEW